MAIQHLQRVEPHGERAGRDTDGLDPNKDHNDKDGNAKKNCSGSASVIKTSSSSSSLSSSSYSTAKGPDDNAAMAAAATTTNTTTKTTSPNTAHAKAGKHKNLAYYDHSITEEKKTGSTKNAKVQGRRRGPGRPPGSRNRATIARMKAEQEAIELFRKSNPDMPSYTLESVSVDSHKLHPEGGGSINGKDHHLGFTDAAPATTAAVTPIPCTQTHR